MRLSTAIKRIIGRGKLYPKLKQKKENIENFFDKKHRVSGQHKYTVVSAVYNVDKYLEEYFESIANQTLKFEDHIYLILVDDGSPDNSADIIKKWQKRYPNNITYVKKENGGQASARNLGIKHVETEWVTFIDPDDFLDYKYFEVVDRFLEKNKENTIGLISCNTLYYDDTNKQYRDAFYLKFCFKKNEKIVNPSNMQGCMQFSASSAFFRNSLLKLQKISFKGNIRPNFEDAHFVNQYLIENNNINIIYLKNAKYMYRKRSDGTSTMDSAWETTEKFLNVLENGYLDILEISQNKLGEIPLFLQRTILSEMTGYFTYLLNTHNKLNHLTENQKETYTKMIEKIFHYIDNKTIEDFHLFDTSYMTKVGFLGRYKQSDISIKKCYIEDYNVKKNEIKIRFFYYDTINILFYGDDKLIHPEIYEITKHDFVNKLFVKEKNIWLPLPRSIKNLKIYINNEKTLITMKGKVFGHKVNVPNLLQKIQIMKRKRIIKKIIKLVIKHNKLKQLQRNIKIFFDKKRRVSGYNTYTVVSAVYNVDKYLEEYFESIVNQTLKFEEHIHLIMVDDGSPDNSVNIIKKWQKRYPNNITYVKKENGGQASARNLGMKHVETEWVTFIDPDDFLDYKYFEVVDHFLERNKENTIGLVSCNFIFYYENEHQLSDTHPLKYRFSNKETVMSASKMDQFIQLTVNSVFFKNDLLQNKKIHFYDDIKPSFEDGYFVNQFLIENKTTKVAFLKDAKYLYRKRSDGTSTLDTSWTTTDRYHKILTNGYLRILDLTKEKEKHIPLFLQRTILYEMMWNHSYLLNDPSKIAHLNTRQKEEYLCLLQKVFHHIEQDTIENFDLAGFSELYRVAFTCFYKHNPLTHYVCYIEDIDEVKSQILLRYFDCSPKHNILKSNGTIIQAVFSKIKKNIFVDQNFVFEKFLWIKFSDLDHQFKINIEDKKTVLSLNGKQYNDTISMSAIKQNLIYLKGDTQSIKSFFFQKLNVLLPFKDTWILIDRDIQADDNAEHLYRYISNNHKEIDIYFVLRKNSHDWMRLKKDGFRLIPFGSLKFAMAFFSAKHLISSNADHYITDYFPRRWFNNMIKHRFTFLQHGVIHTDLSNWLNNKKIDCFVCSTPREYHSIVDDMTSYKFTKKEVVLTGLPRHDALIEGKNKKEKLVLIMPTWRNNLVGKLIKRGHLRSKNKHIGSSSYIKNWKAILHSQQLKSLCDQYEYKIIFFPHVNMQPYLDIFDVPDHIETLSHSEGSIQTLFQRASVLVTDYSSVAFEMGILQKLVIYFQFDHEEVLGGKHTFKKGYFDYNEDGFGPVCYERSEVFDSLKKFFESDGIVPSKYMERTEEFYAFRDKNNSKRVFKAIQNLDKNEDCSISGFRLSYT